MKVLFVMLLLAILTLSVAIPVSQADPTPSDNMVTSAVLAESMSRSAPCDYYASPDGAGDGLSPSTAFQIRAFWRLAGPGKTLCLTDGTYTGDDSMLTIGFDAPALSGVSGDPITVRALNDGKVLIDGEFQRIPVYLRGNSYFVLEGFNAARGSEGVITVSQSSHNVLRRIIAWNAFDGGPGSGTNNHVFGIVSSDDTLVEDSTAFGTGRNIFITYASTNTTFRRTWGRWEGYSSNTGPKNTYQLLYHSDQTLCENCLGTWTSERLADCAGLGYDPAIFKFGTDPQTLTRLVGSIAYQKAVATCNPLAGVYTEGQVAGDVHIRISDVVSFMPIDGSPPLLFNNVKDGVATRITGIGTSASSFGNWTITDVNENTTVAAVPSVYTGTNAANVCFRSVGGSLTAAPLWPWPMDARIAAALEQAGSSPLSGGSVTAEVESLLGAIPVSCRTP